jgi:hypothetical protein
MGRERDLCREFKLSVIQLVARGEKRPASFEGKTTYKFQ